MLYGILEISIDLFGCQCAGGDEQIRTADPLLAKQVLSQLSYVPWVHGKAVRIAAPSCAVAARAPPSARGAHTSPREVLQTLRPEEWERQNETLNLVCLCTRKNETRRICTAH